MALLVVRGGACLACCLVVLSACSIASPTYVTTQEGQPRVDEDATAAKTQSDENAGTGTSSSPASACASKLVKPDLAKLVACEGGKGHCYAKDKVPSLGDQLVACTTPGDVCVPDEILVAGGAKLKACKSYGGMDGGCVTSALLPQVAAQGGSVLPRDVCDADQQCLPCVDPIRNNAPTPFCQPIGVSDVSCSGGGGSTSGGTSAPSPASTPCCTTSGQSSGICIAESAVPEAQRDKTKQDVCPAQNKCVPKALAEGKPVKCSAGILGSGVCLDKCFDDMMSAASSLGVLSRDTCGATEVCIPCLFAKSEGMPGCN